MVLSERMRESQESFPQLERVENVMQNVTRAAAIRSAYLIKRFPSYEGELSADEKKARVKELDTNAAVVMEAFLNRAPFRVVSVGSEGGKEALSHKHGEAMPTVLGEFGNGYASVSMVNDPVEGTTAAAHGRPGAISIVAVSTKDGLMATPEGVHYMDKLFAPAGVNGKVSLDASVEENLSVVAEQYNLQPNQIQAVILNRSRNQDKINASQKFGANVRLIEAGDLLPSLLALREPTSEGAHVVLGSGGWEEGVIAACAAKALGAVAEGRVWSEDFEIKERFPERLSVAQLVPGKSEHSLVIFTPITYEPWLNIPGVEINSSVKSHTVTIDHDRGFSVGSYTTDCISLPREH